jgi:FKBP-type peptidyl-prolyl cis-trans isomerase 2
MAEIDFGKTVSLKYVVTLDDGTVVDKSEESGPFVFTVGDPNVIPGLVDAVKGLADGDKKEFSVEPQHAYGEREPGHVRELPRSLFPEDIEFKAGEQLEAIHKNGQAIPFTVLEIRPETILADFNHVLAGRTLHFEVEVLEVTESFM